MKPALYAAIAAALLLVLVAVFGGFSMQVVQ
jgi:hypothetical protein